MKFFLLICLFLQTALAHEKIVKTKADKFAFGKFVEQKHHQWPYPVLSIGNNMQTYQNYGGSPYWHDGVDIRSREYEIIQAAAGGKVVNIENYIPGNHMYWEVAILDADGFVWKYHHVAKESIPAEIYEAHKKGTIIKAGTVLGNVVRWPISSMGEVYHHCHLLVVAKDGKYVNPFLMMEPLADTQAPVIHKIGIAKNHRPVAGDQVSGAFSLYVKASDLTLHQKYILPPYKISYRLNQAEEKVVWEFINLPSGTNDTSYIEDFYLKGTCGDYSCREYLFNLNFSQSAPRAQMNLKAGAHEIEVTVEDIVGNKATQSYRWTVL